MLLSLVALKKAQLEYPIGHTVSFHSSIARAEAFRKNADIISSEFPDTARLNTYHVSGATPTSVRQRQLNEFADTPNSLITNARCLTEGVDVPNIDCVMFADPRRSTVDIVQAVGRALRPSAGKEFGYVLVPVMVDQLGDEFSIDELNVYAPILAVLRALASNDERIVEQFSSVSGGASRAKGPIIDPIFTARVSENVDIASFISNVEIHCWSKLARMAPMAFDDARSYVRSLNLKSLREWRAYCKNEMPNMQPRPYDIPSVPERVYKNIWQGMSDWLGTGNVKQGPVAWLPFLDARIFARSLKLISSAQWHEYCKSKSKPQRIPSNPNKAYPENWLGMADWLGTSNLSARQASAKFLDFNSARTYVHGLALKDTFAWQEYCKSANRPDFIPTNPGKVYSQNWTDFNDWLGNGKIKIVWADYNHANQFAISLRLTKRTDWAKYVNGEMPDKPVKPIDIPNHPNDVYNKSWKSWGEWLGTGVVAYGNIKYLPFESAHKFVLGLHLKSKEEWYLYCKGSLLDKPPRPRDIPVKADNTYKTEWKGWSYWVGKQKG